MGKSWCLSDREFPEFFKTPITINLSVNKKGVIADTNRRRVLLWTTVFWVFGFLGFGAKGLGQGLTIKMKNKTNESELRNGNEGLSASISLIH